MIKREPYYDTEKDRWYVDKDPNNEWFYVGDMTAELTLNNTTAISCTAVVDRMTVMSAPVVQTGMLVVLKVSGPSPKVNPDDDDARVTLRVTCANGEQFDKTIWFKAVED